MEAVWTRVDAAGAAPSSRSGHTLTAVGGDGKGTLVVLYGGTDVRRKAYLGDVCVLDVAKNAWIETPLGAGSGVGAGDARVEPAEDAEPTAPRVAGGSMGAGAAAGKGGGSGEVGSEESSSSNPTHPGERAFHCAAALSGTRIAVFGGRKGRTRFNDTWLLDTCEWAWRRPRVSGPLPAGRDFAAAAACGNDDADGDRLVVYGGWDGAGWLGDAWLLHLSADGKDGTWQTLSLGSPAPAPRSGHALLAGTEQSRRLYIFGGGTSSGALLNDSWSLDVEPDGTSACAKLPASAPTPQGRSGHSMSRLGPVMVSFGGHGTSGWLQKTDKYMDFVWLYALPTLRWSHAACKQSGTASPAARAYHASASVGGRVLICGGYDGKASLDDCWWLALRDGEAASVQTSASQPAAPAPHGQLTKAMSQAHEKGQQRQQQQQQQQQQQTQQQVGSQEQGALSAPAPQPQVQAQQQRADKSRSTSFFSTLAGNLSKAMPIFGGASGSSAQQPQPQRRETATVTKGDDTESAKARAWRDLRRRAGLEQRPQRPSAPRLAPPAAPTAALAAIGRRVSSQVGGPVSEQSADEDAAIGRAYLLSCDPDDLALDEVGVMLSDYRRAVWGKSPGPALGDEGSMAWQAELSTTMQFVNADVASLHLVDVEMLQMAYSSVYSSVAC